MKSTVKTRKPKRSTKRPSRKASTCKRLTGKAVKRKASTRRAAVVKTAVAKAVKQQELPAVPENVCHYCDRKLAYWQSEFCPTCRRLLRIPVHQ